MFRHGRRFIPALKDGAFSPTKLVTVPVERIGKVAAWSFVWTVALTLGTLAVAGQGKDIEAMEIGQQMSMATVCDNSPIPWNT